MSRFSTLSQWLSWQETLHPSAIELGLQRIYSVAREMNLIDSHGAASHAFSGELSSGATVVTVAGTNGKGSCVSTLATLLSAQGISVGSYTSPHLHRYNERIRINGQEVSDQQLCDAFSAIDNARGDTSLTYFEFGTLAALYIFVQQQVSYVVLEVGLGGRLDAVNIVDSSIAVITSIDIDHIDWLGDDRNVISQEKLGVARSKHPLVIAERSLTPALEQALIDYPVYLINRDFSIGFKHSDNEAGCWSFSFGELQLEFQNIDLPVDSVAAAIVVLTLNHVLPALGQLESSVAGLKLAGRFERQKVADKVVIFDVAHNPASAKALATRLEQMPTKGRYLAVFGVMVDKAITEIVGHFTTHFDKWFVGDLPNNSRAASGVDVSDALEALGCNVALHNNLEEAFQQAMLEARGDDVIVVFGSFFTVSAVREVALIEEVHIG